MNFTDKELEMLKTKERIIEKLINKEISMEDCKNLIQRSERTIYRLKDRYKKTQHLYHGLKGKPSNHQWENTKYWTIINIFMNNTKLHDFSPTELKDYLEEEFCIIIGRETLRQLMIRNGIRVSKAKKRKIKHQKRNRKWSYWEMVQFDWSYHDWFENGESNCLLVAIDDARGSIYTKFTKNECLQDVLEFWKEYIEKFGKPQSIYLDQHATYKVHSPQDQRDEKNRTRFQKWMEKLWIEVIYAHSPEAKWRVERVNKTLQNRLVKKMRLKGIKNKEDGNKYLQEEYLQRHNNKYWSLTKDSSNNHEQISKETMKNYDWYFAAIETRVIKRDGTIQYKNRELQLQKNLILKSKKIIVKETIYWEIKLFDGCTPLEFQERSSYLSWNSKS